MFHQIPATEWSEIGIGDEKLSVEPYVVVEEQDSKNSC